jgi:hypothetical protein
VKIYRRLDHALGKPCPYCRETMTFRQGVHRMPSKDHIKPKSLKKGIPFNKIICCQGCNVDKDCRTIWQWHGILKAKGDRRAPFVLETIVALYSHLDHETYGEVVGRQSDGAAWHP